MERKEITLDGKGICDFFFSSFLGWQFNCDKHTLGLESDNMTVFVELHHDSFRQSFPDETRRVIVHDGTLIHTYTTLGEIVKEVATGRFMKNPVDGETIKFTFGNFTILDEDCQGTEDKPWLTTRTTVTLPFEIERRRHGT